MYDMVHIYIRLISDDFLFIVKVTNVILKSIHSHISTVSHLMIFSSNVECIY